MMEIEAAENQDGQDKPAAVLEASEAELAAFVDEEFIPWCEAHGLSPATVASRATNNSYVVRSMRKRLARSQAEILKVRNFMSSYDDEKKRADDQPE